MIIIGVREVKNRGQALIEFVLLLPVFVFLLLGIIDFGRIMITKNHLESKASDMLTMIQDKSTYDEMVESLNKESTEEVKLELDYQADGYVRIKLMIPIEIMTPGLNLVLGNPYPVTVERLVPYE